jgi:hypothetical protein
MVALNQRPCPVGEQFRQVAMAICFPRRGGKRRGLAWQVGARHWPVSDLGCAGDGVNGMMCVGLLDGRPVGAAFAPGDGLCTREDCTREHQGDATRCISRRGECHITMDFMRPVSRTLL